jgi:hypothetical protein
MPLRDLQALSRHRGCGGRAARVELVTGIEGVSSRPGRRMVLREKLSRVARGPPSDREMVAIRWTAR